MPPTFARLSATLAAGALLGSAACQESTAPAQQPTHTPSAAVVSPELLAAIADVDARVVPSLELETRQPMHVALDALRSALLAGDTAAARRAVAVARAMSVGADADLSAIALVVSVAGQSLEVAR